MSAIKIGVAGASGRMGAAIIRLLQCREDAVFVSGLVSEKSVDQAKNFTANISDFLHQSDVIIDFTKPEISLQLITQAATSGKPVVSGTTGFNPPQFAELNAHAQKIPLLWSANMSVGINVLLKALQQVAAQLGENWDAEIFETHHAKKVDAPSGTALLLGNAIAKGRGRNLDDIYIAGRDGITGARAKGSLGFSVARGGDVVGEHTAFFFGDGERLEFTHRATNRDIFASGAIKAALWLHNKPKGFYSMHEVIGA